MQNSRRAQCKVAAGSECRRQRGRHGWYSIVRPVFSPQETRLNYSHTQDKVTPLFVAAQHGRVGSVQALIEAGAPLDAKTYQDAPWSAKRVSNRVHGHFECPSCACPPTCSQGRRETPLECALEEGHSAVVELLVKTKPSLFFGNGVRGHDLRVPIITALFTHVCSYSGRTFEQVLGLSAKKSPSWGWQHEQLLPKFEGSSEIASRH